MTGSSGRTNHLKRGRPSRPVRSDIGVDGEYLVERASNFSFGDDTADTRQSHRRSVARLLGWLIEVPGQDWQSRWVASGADDLGRRWTDLAVEGICTAGDTSRATAAKSLRRASSVLICLRVLRPSYDWMISNHFNETYRHIRGSVDADLFESIDAAAAQSGVRERVRTDALNHLTRIVIRSGRSLRELTPDDLLHYHKALLDSGRQASSVSLSWEMLRSHNVFPVGTPTLRACRKRGQASVSELVDSYQLSSQAMRDLFVRYLSERASRVDHVSLRSLAVTLVGAFWKDIEDHHPGLHSLDLPADVADAWKMRAAFHRRANAKDRPRGSRYSLLFTVRAMYLDIALWAVEDPTWRPWAARCFIRDADIRGAKKHQRRVQSRMHQRTRTRAPLLPDIVASVEDHLDKMERLLAVSSLAQIDDQFIFDGVTYRRIQMKSDARSENQRGARRVRVEDVATGERLDVQRAEQEAFWTWAVIEVLRHTGVRNEELLELTHFSLVTHILPDTGEVVPLLQIAPSKVDQERVLLVSPELAHALARIVKRVRGEHERIPLVARYDSHERLTGPALPHLFQHRLGVEQMVLSPNYILRLVKNAVQRAQLTAADGEPLHYTVHDFRRIFATEAVSSGLPVHIAAKILGHNNLATTQRYTAVYNDDVLRHHRAHIAKRRSLRPTSEYREPTDEEWSEFERHFTKRKVEFGSCARPYGTPCRHEHACIRCPLLRPDPRQEQRLLAIIINLHDRIAEATERRWLGEVEGLKVSLDAADAKLDQMRRTRSRDTTALLPMPRLGST